MFKDLLQNIKSRILGRRGVAVPQGRVMAEAPSIPTPTPAPVVNNYEGFAKPIQDFYREYMPPSMRETGSVEEYYPNMKYLPKMYEQEQKFNRPGLGTLLALQSFFESTGGRNAYKNNMFGTKPFGQPNGFGDLGESIDYQVSPMVLGGGAAPAMNILNKTGDLTPEEIATLYAAYDPPGAYKENILNGYRKIRNIK